ncbi:polysaccharide deacetylase [Romboutsia weinsteinii]|uniref:Polysaccharide deacetylase n=1 Tax=Romboutsia weinsteinii TaxID=2020949 RepID=A0A371IXR1_9FIRM|nr:polysaccharide deacetylase family protein [Romboutsia weinsteinii]RDY25273.1 polysaccharide deacetylase [Romboutsia weinsteinii]
MNRKFKRTKAFMSSVVFFGLSLVLVFVLVYGIKYICSVNGNSQIPIYRVDTEDKKVALTFDVAWGTDNMKTIMEVLEKHNIKSTFFLVGSWVDDNKEIVKQLSESGHEIGNHSNTHANMTALSDEDITNEIELTSEKISNITGNQTKLYRPPFGEIDSKSMDICESLGYQVIKWDVDSLDWKEIGPNHVIDRVVKGVQPGSIVLFHANVSYVSEYLDNIITRLKKDGYEIVPVSELIYKDNYTINSNGVQKNIED